MSTTGLKLPFFFYICFISQQLLFSDKINTEKFANFIFSVAFHILTCSGRFKSGELRHNPITLDEKLTK